MASVSQWHAHSRTVVFHTLHRFQKYTRLVRYVYSLLLLHTGSLPLHPLRHSFPPSFYVAASVASLAPTIFVPAFYHHRIPTCSPGALSDPSHRSSSDRVFMYCVNVICRRQMSSSIVWNPASSLAVVSEMYFQFPSGFRHGSRPVSRLATWSWNPPRALPMRGVTAQVFEPKSNTA